MKLLLAPALALCLAVIGCAETGPSEPSAEITAATNKVEATVEGMDCSGCTGEVCAAVEQIAGVTGAHADLKTGKVSVALADDADAEAAKAEVEKVIAGLSDGKYTVNTINAISPNQDAEPADAEGDTDTEPVSRIDESTVYTVASYKVDGIHCAGCSGEIESAVEQVAGVNSVKADHKTGTVVVAYDENTDEGAKSKEVKALIAGLSDGKYTVAQ